MLQTNSNDPLFVLISNIRKGEDWALTQNLDDKKDLDWENRSKRELVL